MEMWYINNHPEWGNRPRNTNTASSTLSLVWLLAGNLQTVCLDRRTHRSQGASKQPWGRTSRKRGQNAGEGTQEQRVNVVREEGWREGTRRTGDRKDLWKCRWDLLPQDLLMLVCMCVCVCEICILQIYNRFRGSYLKTGNIIPLRHHRLSNKKCTARMGSLSLSCQWSPTDSP